MKQFWMAISVILAGFLLIAAGETLDLPVTYWQSPKATTAQPPHEWSKLEQDLRPEACAQCHSEQFEDWKASLHAKAYSPGLVGQFPGMGHFEANECLNCHAPLAEQKFSSAEAMDDSVLLRLKHAKGFDNEAELDGKVLPLTHSGVSCAACHVRGWQRFGPPVKPNGLTGLQDGPAHGGFTASADFESSQFCASCHQFPQSMAINGKPLENTVKEWEQSSFGKKGVTCQQCHMPDRKHEFRGIHDRDMVRKGLSFDLSRFKNDVTLAITSKWIGHAFPTYVTPKVIVEAKATDSAGHTIRQWQWEIIREIEYDNGWQEKRDTRLMPGETRKFTADAPPETATSIRYRVKVIPDFFYKGLNHTLLQGELKPEAEQHIQQAQELADSNDYILYENSLRL